MKILRITSNLVALAVLALGFTSMANAQATRTWVSGVGDDANPCSRTAPCKTFAGAISKTATNGEIDCLDPGGFGQVTITKAITIDCDSGPGGILVGAGSGVNINTTGAVVLRSLNINCDQIGGTTGVNVIGATNVHLLDMNIWGCTNAGVNATSSGTVLLTIKDTQIHDCGTGIITNSSGGAIAADFDHLHLASDVTGINAQGGSHDFIHNSTITLNSSFGINQTGNGVVFVGSSTLSFNGTAMQSIAGGTLGASGNLFLGNTTVYNSNGGQISSATDNAAFGNTGNGVANGPAVPKI
jgi:hypothetical protein